MFDCNVVVTCHLDYTCLSNAHKLAFHSPITVGGGAILSVVTGTQSPASNVDAGIIFYHQPAAARSAVTSMFIIGNTGSS